jgi:hypothetical protein
VKIFVDIVAAIKIGKDKAAATDDKVVADHDASDRTE